MSDHTKIGEILTSDQPRDAIHIAVACVVATEKLAPGSPIGFVEGEEHNHNVDVAACEQAMSVGIVDPFLQKNVMPGQRFWMFLHPNTITSLRHNWTHPAFGQSPDTGEDRASSEVWLRDYCSTNDCPDYDTIIEAAKANGKTVTRNGDDYYSAYIQEDYFYVGGSDAHGEIPPEFWDHVEIITGRKLANKPSRFTCSC